MHVPAFAVGLRNITNGEFLVFVREGGYEERRFWSTADWDWIKAPQIGHPHLWFMRQNKWFYRAMFEEVELPLDWPVYVSHAEAAAYARFVGMALPSEAQFHRAAYGTPEGTERLYPWGDAAPDADRGNFDFQRWDPVAAGSYPAGRNSIRIGGCSRQWLGSGHPPSFCALAGI